MLESDIQISESLIFDNDTYRLEFIIDNIIWKNFIHDNNILLQQIAFEAFKEGNLVFDKQRINQMNIIFCNNDIIQTLNADYRQIDKPTNVLSFPTYSKEELDNKEYCFGDIQMFGDIFIAYEYCFVEAQENKKSFTYHIAHMIIHGILHNMGFDHIHDLDAEIMESKEIHILEKFKIANPYV